MALTTHESGVNQTLQHGGSGGENRGSIDARTALRSSDLSDDEILGLGVRDRTSKRRFSTKDGEAGISGPAGRRGAQTDDELSGGLENSGDAREPRSGSDASTERFREIFESNPDLENAWQDAAAFREVFASPEEARNATELLSNLNAMDALFFSSRAEDHTELARLVARLDPKAFVSLAEAMGRVAAETQRDPNGAAANLSSNLGLQAAASGGA